ncbi:unnamed protein product [Cylicocyclus nassatus]|uniref:NADP-dependent oxidoreductase domain-containing protein n=1 Tax=Cylicocyclus nassatus TaxID=53992 RepID=A0AA36M3Q9_CYLNA|nr:unnamed protein product [Cylicocyclus nassatus]
MAAPTVMRNSGHAMPVVGNAVESAIKNGYKHLDCAWMYHNQEEIGKTLKSIFFRTEERRHIYYLQSKDFIPFSRGLQETRSRSTEPASTGLRRFDADTFSNGLPVPTITIRKIRNDSGELQFSEEDYLTTYKVLEDFVKEGKIRSIGVSNFNLGQLKRLLANCHIKPAVLQVEARPYLPQKEVRDFCKEKGIALVAYSRHLVDDFDFELERPLAVEHCRSAQFLLEGALLYRNRLLEFTFKIVQQVLPG